MNRPLAIVCGLVVVVGCQQATPPTPNMVGDKGPGLPPDYFKKAPPNAEIFRAWVAAVEQHPVLLRHWDEVAHYCRDVLTDGDDDPLVVIGALRLLSKASGDRSSFVPTVVELLGHKSHSVRDMAAECLAAIGGERECAPVALLLRDENNMVRLAAAKTLAAIGGEREVAVFDLTRKMAERAAADGKPIITPEDLERFDKHREKLVARLKQQEKDKPKAAPTDKK